MKTLKRAVIAAIAPLAVIQVIRPGRTNPAVDESRTIQVRTQMPADVAAILDPSRKDCHSHETRWPWYSQIAPVSWYVAYDVNKGRKEFSLSDWARCGARRTARKLKEICEQLEKGEMPPWDYSMVHPSARLSDSDKRVLCDWAKAERGRVLAAQTTSSP